MGGGRKSKPNTAVAPIFRSRGEQDRPRGNGGNGGQGSDSESELSEHSHTQDQGPLTKRDLQSLLQDIKCNIAAGFAKHLAPLKEEMADLTKRTSDIEDRMLYHALPRKHKLF
ncbi:Hypothetical predicted protein [Pelobates cultripes]|uniref:Uncharacterized protein n=1 Tax=Pelobates cultripes TaxID=61616 RepID=A0AAD1RMD8_PELCU|nr:Hypothetical predicted protein [Pelobates cultripes]